VIVGMTGSGKTGLLTVLVEEALRNRVPVLVIDVKGDLPNLRARVSFLRSRGDGALGGGGRGRRGRDRRSALVLERRRAAEEGPRDWKIGEAELAAHASRRWCAW
jgi:DNA helicase HerA-like ATPase